MNPHEVNYLDQRNKILGLTPQQLVKPRFLQFRNRCLSWLLKDVDIDVLKVKHIEVTSKNTLTTPKIVLTDSATDPANNGEITRNGTAIKGKTGGSVVTFGRDLAFDLSDKNEMPKATTNFISFATNVLTNPSSYTTRASITIAPTTAKNIVALAGYVCIGIRIASSRTTYIKIVEGGVDKVSEVTKAFAGSGQIDGVACVGTVQDVSVASHTYDMQCKDSNGDGNSLMHGSITGAIVKLV